MSQTFGYGVTITVEAALSAATGVYALYGTATFGTSTFGPDANWTDISAYVRRVETLRRFGREVGAWETGTATIVLDNRTGRFDPDNLAGPYVTAGVTQIRPWRPVRIRATYAGVTYDVFRGYILSWPETYPGQADSEITVACVDEFGLIARFDGLEQAPVGAGEQSGRRIHRILDNAAYQGTRNIDLGQITVQATTLAQNALTEVKLTSDSEGGAVWCEPDGSVTFENRYALIENARSNTVQATFGDGGGTEIPYTDIVVEYDGDQVHNYVQYARTGGTVQTAADATSRALYGDQSQGNRSDLICETDAQALDLARYHLAVRKDPEKRITSISLAPAQPQRAAVVMPQALGRRVRDLIRVVRRPTGRPNTITRDVFVSGIAHRFDAGDWRTTFELFSATGNQVFSSSRYDAATFDFSVFSY